MLVPVQETHGAPQFPPVVWHQVEPHRPDSLLQLEIHLVPAEGLALLLGS